MSMNIRFPSINGATEAEQLVQIKSYLHQLVEQLNWALTTIEKGTDQAKPATKEPAVGDISAEFFYEMKTLLIRSSDTLNAYYEKINLRLEESYLKKDFFESYVGATDRRFEKLSDQYLSHEEFSLCMEEIVQEFDDLEDQYVSQTEFDEYKQEISQIPPNVGENGNWFIGENDTGVPATGKDGHSPVRGEDYWTDTDKEEIVNEVVGIVGEKVTSYTEPTSIRLKSGMQFLCYSDDDSGTVTFTFGDATFTHTIASATECGWFLWMQTEEESGSVISQEGTITHLTTGGVVDTVPIEYSGSGSYIVITIGGDVNG